MKGSFQFGLQPSKFKKTNRIAVCELNEKVDVAVAAEVASCSGTEYRQLGYFVAAANGGNLLSLVENGRVRHVLPSL